MRPPRHILVLVASAPATADVLAQAECWAALGHRVTVLARDVPPAASGGTPTSGGSVHVERLPPRLTGLRAAYRCWRGTGRDADVVLEVVDERARFLAPLWWFLAGPCVTLVRRLAPPDAPRLSAALREQLPLRVLFRHGPVLTVSLAVAEDLVARGIPRTKLHVAYPGVDPAAFRTPARDPAPSLVHVGNGDLDLVLAVLEGVPDARLELAGAGRGAAAAAVSRGLGDRVTVHDEVDRAALLARAWVHLPSGPAEGWCPAVMEAAAAGTPSAALAPAGVPESIVPGHTGLLADSPEALAEAVAGLVADPDRRDALGEAAQARARGYSWDTTARAGLSVLEGAAEAERPKLREALRRSETGAAAGLAVATLINNAIQLVFTIVFTRLLGADGYGALAAIISAFLILMVGGQSIQVAAAREATLGHLGDPARLHRTLRTWTRHLLLATVALCVVCALARDPIAHVLGVPEYPWAAAAILPTGALWLLLSLQRGVLQGLRAYSAVGGSIVGEAFGRIVWGLVLVGAGLGVTGAYLGTPLALLATSAVLAHVLAERLGPPERAREHVRALLSLISDNRVPIFGLLLLASLQNIDVIVGRHEFSGDEAGSYAVAAVAAKAVVWVAIGVGLQLLPEATRRAAAGLDPRPTLLRALAVLGVIAAPSLLIFLVAGEPLLRIAFGPDLTLAADALPVLGLAMTLLAVTYLTVQYMVALGELRFVWVLLVAAVLEPFLLMAWDLTLLQFAGVVLGVQLAAALGVLALGLHTRRAAGRSFDAG